MSTYATTAALASRLGNAFASLYRGTAADAQDDLAQAAAEVDAYLSGRYQVPVRSAQAQTLLESWTLTLAEEKAFLRAAGSSIPEKVSARVETVRKQLRDAANGVLRLPGAQPAAMPGSAAGATAIPLDIEPPVMGRKRMKGY